LAAHESGIQLLQRFSNWYRDFISPESADSEVASSIENLRPRLLQGLLFSSLLLIPAFIPDLFKWIHEGRFIFIAFCLLLWTLALLVLLSAKRISYRHRAGITLAALYICGLIILTQLGLSGAGNRLFLLFCVLTTVLLGIRSGLIAIIFSAVAIGFVGLGMTTGLIPIDVATMANSTSSLAWTANFFFSLAVNLIAVLAPGFLLQMLDTARGVTARQSLELTEAVTQLHHEIAERENTVEQLRQNQQRYQAIFNTTFVGICLCGPDRRYGDANDRFVELLGYSRRELRTMRVCAMHSAADAKTALRAFDALDHGAESQNFEIAFKTKDGRTVWAETWLTAVRGPEGELRGYLKTLVDITDKRETAKVQEHFQEQLLQAQKLEVVAQLAGGVAHDFNNILTGIGGYAEMILLSLPAGSELATDLHHIHDASKRAAKLTQQLLAFSRQQMISPRQIDLREVIENAKPMIAGLVPEHIDIDFTIAGVLWPVLADPTQIEQVLFSLVTNACDAMPTAGHFTVAASNVTVADHNATLHPDVLPGQYVLIAFTDTGVGMDEATRRQAFEPFFSTKTKAQASGLGLSTVYGVARQNGGFVTVESSPGAGATLRVYLPRADGAAPAMPLPPPDAGSKTVLLVEDEAMVREIVARVLSRDGYHVITANNGPEALGRISELKHLDMLLTDIVMPGMSGVELSEKVKLEHPQASVVFMSGYNDEVIARHGKLPGDAFFIQKPFTIDRFISVVRQALPDA
jgi:PAS domain S-box-containing protein